MPTEEECLRISADSVCLSNMQLRDLKHAGVTFDIEGYGVPYRSGTGTGTGTGADHRAEGGIAKERFHYVSHVHSFCGTRVERFHIAMASFFFILPDNYTAAKAAEEPPWGRALEGLPAVGGFQMSDWHDLAHVVLYRLARHPGRTLEAGRATACVVASPVAKFQEAHRALCIGRAGAVLADRFRALGQAWCPGKPIVVVDGADGDGANTALCSSMWSPRSCELGGADPLIRVTGNAPGLQSEVASGLRRGLCRRLLVPYLAHARTPYAAEQSSQPRTLRIAYAAASWGHVDADAHGFVAWRKSLRNACKKLHATDAAHCSWVWISMSGNGAEKALQLYQRSDFCLRDGGEASNSAPMACMPCHPKRDHPTRAAPRPHTRIPSCPRTPSRAWRLSYRAAGRYVTTAGSD